MKYHFLDKLQNFETVINIYGSVYQRTCGAGKFVSCVEVPNRCGSDYAFVANQVALTLYEGVKQDMESSNMRITQAELVWDMIRTSFFQYQA